MSSGRIIGAFILTLFSGPALAGSYGDTYWGGMDSQNVSNKDVIGSSSVFNISSVDVSRTNGGNTLKIVIHTPYAGVPGTSAALGTNYGNLFFTSASNYTPTGSSSGGHYATDVYQPKNIYGNNDWTWAFVTSTSSATPTGLYQIGAVTQKNDYYKNGKDTGVAKSYTTLDGKIIMANVNGDPISGDNGSIFRQGQAVQYTPDGKKGLVAGTTANSSMSVSASNDTITYLINDQHTLGDTFAMSWAMTCANDVFQRVVSVPGPVVGGGLPGLLAVIAGLWVWRRRSERVSISLA